MVPSVEGLAKQHEKVNVFHDRRLRICGTFWLGHVLRAWTSSGYIRLPYNERHQEGGTPVRPKTICHRPILSNREQKDLELTWGEGQH